MRIYVSQVWIDQGKRKNCGECPVALSIQAAFPNAKVSVREEDVRIDGTLHKLPPEAVAFIDDFDNFLPVQPFAFDLPIGKPEDGSSDVTVA